MHASPDEPWRELCEAAAKERDFPNFLELFDEISGMLEEMESRMSLLAQHRGLSLLVH
jgi:hypothetical protein